MPRSRRSTRWSIEHFVPSLVDYRQPDFRDPRIIDQENGPQPIPLCLMLRRIGKEYEPKFGSWDW